MFRKNCYKCHRPSFSSSESREWLCPTCGSDLTNQRIFDAMAFEKMNRTFGLYKFGEGKRNR
ncbi:ribosomal protein L37AE/L43A [Peribacillus cavernae]|nr:ribosomal protein L37AE/L43A [Peribacillus cavernae]